MYHLLYSHPLLLYNELPFRFQLNLQKPSVFQTPKHFLEEVSIWDSVKMSMPLDQQQHPPPSPSLTVTQLPYTSSSRHGSVGPLIAVLAVVAILGALAAIVGRFCSGRRIMGHGQYDIESWLEEKCSSCIDGRINPPPLPSADVSTGSAPPSIPVHTHAETKQEDDPSPKNPPPSGGS